MWESQHYKEIQSFYIFTYSSEFPESGLCLTFHPASWCFCNLLISLGGSREKWPVHFIASLISIKFCFLVPSLRIFSLSFRDVKCGKIHCSRRQHSFLPGKEKINHLKKISKQNVTTECKTFILYHNSKDLGLVAPGTKCGDGMVRWKSFVLLKLLGSATLKHYFL